MLDGHELEELAGVQLGQLVDAALHDQVRGVEGPGGAVVVLGKGRVDGGSVEEKIELRLPCRPSPTIREAISGDGSVDAASSQAPEARCQRAVVAFGGSIRSEGLAGAVELVELDGAGDQADEAAAVDELAGGHVDAIGRGGAQR